MKLSREARRQARELFALTIVDGRLDTTRLDTVFGGVAEKKPRSYLEPASANSPPNSAGTPR